MALETVKTHDCCAPSECSGTGRETTWRWKESCFSPVPLHGRERSRKWRSRQMASFPCDFKVAGTMLCRHPADCFSFHVRVTPGSAALRLSPFIRLPFHSFARGVLFVSRYCTYIVFLAELCSALHFSPSAWEMKWCNLFEKKSVRHQGLFSLVGAVNKLRMCVCVCVCE